MKRVATTFIVMLTTSVIAASAMAALRSPQVPVLGGSLQGYLNSVGESINVLTDQQDILTWASTVSGNSTFTMQIELAGNAAANTIGLYGGADGVPILAQVFPGAATAGWFAVASFKNLPTRVIVNFFDQNAIPVGSNTYTPGPDRNNFGFYLQGPGGTFFTQDVRNPGGAAQAVTYAGTGVNAGSWWLCWEDLAIVGGGADQDREDAVLFLESLNPTPANTTSWGQVKARFLH
jgi:hypothetical protein